MIRRFNIAVCGDASLSEDHPNMVLAERLGMALVDEGYRVVTGGLGGIMEAVSTGARASKKYRKGDVIGILPGTDPKEANEYVDIAIATGLDHVRNYLIANSDAIIAIGGGAGTLSEVAFAWMSKRLIISYRTEGWSGRLADTRIDDRTRIKDFRKDIVFGVDNEEEAIEVLGKYLPLYNAMHHGIKRRK